MARVAITAGLATLGSRPAATAAVSRFSLGGESRGVARQNFRRDAWCRWLCDHGPTARTWKRSCAGLSKTCCPTPLVSETWGGLLGGVYGTVCQSHWGRGSQVVGVVCVDGVVGVVSMVDMVSLSCQSVSLQRPRQDLQDPPSGQLDRSLATTGPSPSPNDTNSSLPSRTLCPSRPANHSLAISGRLGGRVRMELAN